VSGELLQENKMRKVFVATIFVFCWCLTATAQDYPKAEVFGGYSYFRGDEAENLHGWGASIAGNFNKWFGVVADFSGHYGQDFLSVSDGIGGFVTAESDNNIHNFLFGPRFSYRDNPTVEGFVHVLVGGSRAHVSATFSTPGFSTSIDRSDTAFATAIGGGVDAKLHRRVAWRVFQADYVLTRFDDDNQHNFRVATGLVLRLGN
jgi:hypothetical protein